MLEPNMLYYVHDMLKHVKSDAFIHASNTLNHASKMLKHDSNVINQS